jgi:hypothetical protein
MNREQMTIHSFERPTERGQVVVLVLLVLGLFLTGISAFGVDFANFWFHRQAAQGAADAACTAGVMDMLRNANESVTTFGNFPGGDYDCSTAPTSAPCQYASLNGYNSDGLTPGNTVHVSFAPTSSVPGIDPNAIPGVASNMIQIDVTERVQTFFSGFISGNRTQTVRVRARCAILKATTPVPLTVLNPSCAGSLSTVGNGNVAITGGPPKSVQVNSDDGTAVNISGSGTIDLSHGGPAFSGSFLGVSGGPGTAPGGFSGGTTGGWQFATPVPDPFANVPAPTVPADTPTPPASPITVAYPDAVYGCPDHSGCDVYKPGRYTSGIQVTGRTVLFVPGLYYFQIADTMSFIKANCGDPRGCVPKPTGQCYYALTAESNGVLRMAKNTSPSSDTSHGVTFYLSGPGGVGGYGSVFFGSNAGNPGGRTIDSFNTLDANDGVTCPMGTAPDPALGLPASINGNVLMGPCTYDGSYFNSPTNVPLSVGAPAINRGMLFFQDRNDGNNDGQPSMQGGGGLLLVGTMYFHHCPSLPCNPATAYKAFYELLGNSGSGTYLLGNITTDRLIVGGSGDVSMQLSSAKVYTILKASLIQ